ncbi:uncharacterized protein LOC123449599 [Hordeum vulgare subsp. vulgare]|uniref:Uncharacterized protein n=1 Tax=Hordeum vulgare subsp. vulgare TaxID=112509 RepID=A0A8I6XHV3_HORVV|nr:uncharacterized protein LOC123449599 [Hordeum vulgare subsp. vulgare]
MAMGSRSTPGANSKPLLTPLNGHLAAPRARYLTLTPTHVSPKNKQTTLQPVPATAKHTADSSSSSSVQPCKCNGVEPRLQLQPEELSLLALAAAALGPALLLRPRPTPFGWALVSVHAATLLSALASLHAHAARRRLCCHAHAVAALCGHALAACALLLRRDRCLALLASARDRREQVALVLLEAALLLAMFLVQALALAVACAVGRRWAGEHEAVEAEKAAAVTKRGRKMRRVQQAESAEAGVGAVTWCSGETPEGSAEKKM